MTVMEVAIANDITAAAIPTSKIVNARRSRNRAACRLICMGGGSCCRRLPTLSGREAQQRGYGSTIGGGCQFFPFGNPEGTAAPVILQGFVEMEIRVAGHGNRIGHDRARDTT